MERQVSYHHLEKRFGVMAVEMGFITAAQLHEAMTIQLNEGLQGMAHRLMGQILVERGHISSGQIREVLLAMGLPTRFCLCDYPTGTGSQTSEKIRKGILFFRILK
jgi:hypothetical protein